MSDHPQDGVPPVDPDQERTRQMSQQIAALYEGWGKPDEAAEWRAKLPKPATAAPAK